MSQSRILLVIAFFMIVVGILKPDVSEIFSPNIQPCPVSSIENYVTEPPKDPNILSASLKVKQILLDNRDKDTFKECLKLSALYNDIANLIELDNNETVVKDTATIKEANSLCGQMLRLNIKDKYPNLAEASREVIVSAIGDKDIVLEKDSRFKAVEAFRALSWAFYEGSK